MTTVTLAPAFASERHHADPGLEKADNNIHEHAPSQADDAFHKGTCRGGFDAGSNGICTPQP
jgi:hypothetical protein